MTEEELNQLSDLLERNLPSEPHNPRVYPSNFHTEMGATMQPQYGMTLLDFFAGQAMQGLCAYNGPGYIVDLSKIDLTAERAYSIAAAMLKERQKHIK